MDKLINLILTRRTAVLLVFSVVTILSGLMIPKVNINYDLAEYLPDEMDTKKAITTYEKEFGYSGLGDVMLKDVSIEKATEYKDKIASVEGVKTVLWLDAFSMLGSPGELPPGIVEKHYKDGYALLRIEFSENDYSAETDRALNSIREIVGEKGVVVGSAANNQVMRNTTIQEVFIISIAAVLLFVLILMLATQSWIEPALYLSVIGVSVIINLGSNFIFPSISFITNSTAAILQLAISMDYSLFLVHRYLQERKENPHEMDAMEIAIKSSIKPLLGSCLTTVAGFAALMLMRYRIGYDMGIVLAKGIVISLLCSVILLPSLTLLCTRLIDQTSHRKLLPRFSGFASVIIKTRYAGVILLILLALPAYWMQSSNSLIYGDEAISGDPASQAAMDAKEVAERFGVFNPVIMLLPLEDIPSEKLAAAEIGSLPHVSEVQSLQLFLPEKIPESLLPKEILSQFRSDEYGRMIINLDTPTEGPEAFDTVTQIKKIGQEYFKGNAMVLGISPSVLDIKSVVDKDFGFISLVSAFAVGLIICLLFRSLAAPVILVLIIQCAIWVNMSIPYLQGVPLVFIGFMIVSAIQLGATVDYAILLTDRYVTNRITMHRFDAAKSAIINSADSIVTSSVILTAAGICVGVISDVKAISEMGMLIGRGAFLSGLFVMIFLPQALVVFDRFIGRRTKSLT